MSNNTLVLAMVAVTALITAFSVVAGNAKSDEPLKLIEPEFDNVPVLSDPVSFLPEAPS
jgi:hypothetical protein